eukprot:190828-Ditylum_brightwellii.AAC.2
MPFDLGDLVNANHHVYGGYHQAWIEMVIDNGRQYLISWVNQDRSDTHERATPNQNGCQDEADKVARIQIKYKA